MNKSLPSALGGVVKGEQPTLAIGKAVELKLHLDTFTKHRDQPDDQGDAATYAVSRRSPV
jgi:hypothetical protein